MLSARLELHRVGDARADSSRADDDPLGANREPAEGSTLTPRFASVRVCTPVAVRNGLRRVHGEIQAPTMTSPHI